MIVSVDERTYKSEVSTKNEVRLTDNLNLPTPRWSSTAFVRTQHHDTSCNMAQCKALADPDSLWSFCPSLPAAYLFAVLFGLITTIHIVQSIVHRKFYSIVVIISAGMQTATYVLRVLSINDVSNEGFYSYWFILMMVAPVFTNAYVYMIMGRMVYNFTAEASIFKIPAWRFGLIFVLLDVVAFFVQAAGAVVASGDGKSTSTIMNGLHIYMGGIGFQQACIFAFLALAIRFHLNLRKQRASTMKQTALTLLRIQYAVLLLITIRIIFRLIEYSDGLESSIPNHEAYQYVFDSFLMMVALVLYNVWHPGRLMPGSESNLPSRKQRKALRKQGLAVHGRAREELLTEYKPVDAASSIEDNELECAPGRRGQYSPV